MSAIKEAMMMLEEFDLATNGFTEYADQMTRRLDLKGEYHLVYINRTGYVLNYIWTIYKEGEYPLEIFAGTNVATLLNFFKINGMKKHISEYGKQLMKSTKDWKEDVYSGHRVRY